MEKVKFYFLFVLIGLLCGSNTFAQFTPEDGQIYYIIHKASGYAITENPEDNRSILKEITTDNTAQQMSIIESHIAGEYFIINQDSNYWHYFEGWKMGFAADTAETSSDYRFTFIPGPETGDWHLHAVSKPDDQVVGTDDYNNGAGIYPDKSMSNDRGVWLVLSPDELGFNDPTLASLTTTVGELSPEFNSEVLEYELSVPYGTEAIQLAAVANGKAGSVVFYDGLGNEIVNGLVAFSGDGVDVEVVVSAADGTELSYYVAIFVDEGHGDATLGSINLSKGALDPAFSGAVTEYTLIVPNGTTMVDVIGFPNFPEASVSGSGTITLSNGSGLATLVVTSFDASATTTYNINIEEADGKNYALHLPGVLGAESNVDISGLALKTLPYTIEMWIKPEGAQNNNAGLLYGRNGEVHAGVQYSSGWQGAGRMRFMTNISGDYGVVSDVISTDMWHHVAVVLTENYRTLYIDGTVYKEAKANAPYDYSEGQVFLGWDHGGTDRALKGLIDEVRVWNDSLSAEQLDANSYEVLVGNESNLVAYYNFDLPNSSQAVDATSGQNHGLITGGTYTESFPRANLELDTLAIDGMTLKPVFSPKVTDYYVTFERGTTSANIVAEAADSKATVSGSGSVAVEGDKGSYTVTVTSQDGQYSLSYNIHYVVNTPLTLNHSYTFADGTATDVVAGANGVINGGSVEGGVYTASNPGDHIELPAGDIAINLYPSITVEAYVMAGNGLNGGNTMLSYFGNTSGSYGTDYFYTALANGGKSRTAISCGSYSAPWGAETGVDGLLIDDGASHHIVSTMTNDTIRWYIDGMLVNSAGLAAHNTIGALSDAMAYLCKGGYVNDATWLGSIYEFNIYSGVMDAETVAMRSITYPTDSDEAVATLSELLVDGVAISDFAPTKLNYDSIMTAGVTTVPVVTATAQNAGATVTVTNADQLPGTTTVVVTSANGENSITYTINFNFEVSSDAALADLLIDGASVSGFSASTYSYDVELAEGTATVPTVTATANHSAATVVVTAATELPGTTNVVVTAEDGSTTATYSIHFTVELSADASLADLKVDGTTVEGFDAATLSYIVELPTGTTAVPAVTATASNTGASVQVNAAAALPGTTTVVVTAADGTKVTYSIEFKVKVAVNGFDTAAIKVFPTVTNSSFTVQTEGGESLISVYDITGSKVSEQRSTSAKTLVNVEQNGMYLLKVENNQQVKTFRIIKQ